MARNLKIGVLISGGGSNLQAIIDACEQGKINGEVVFVGSDKPDVYGLERAKKHKIPTFVVDYKKIFQGLNQLDRSDIFSFEVASEINLETLYLKSKGILPNGLSTAEDAYFWLVKRVTAEMEMLRHMDDYEFDLLTLAGFMRNLTAYFIDQINTNPERSCIMNIHPALLPSFPGTDGYGDTFRYGCKVGGCTVHFVDYGEDTGPIIGQKSYTIELSDTEDTIREKGLKLEHELYSKCIQLFAENRLRIIEKKGRKVVKILDERRIL